VAEVEVEVRRPASELAHVKGEHDSGGGRFGLIAAHVGFRQELPLQDNDPLWSGSGRDYDLPSAALVDRLGWTRSFGCPEWRDSSGVIAARLERWHYEQNSKWSYGHRLIVRADALEKALRPVPANGASSTLDVVWLIRMSRDVVRGGERDGEHDMGTRRAFLWTQIGDLLLRRDSDRGDAAGTVHRGGGVVATSGVSQSASVRDEELS
jgi:hypothetical protein